jgi:hypothetical protein
MPGMGPAPKPADQRRRRNATVPMLQLPAGGRKGPTPKWPLSDQVGLDGELVAKLRAREKEIWRRVWRTPAAAAWERLGWYDVVARYVRLLVHAESSTRSEVLSEVRQLEDRLGLNPLAMLRLRWEVAADEVAEWRADRPARARPRAVDPSAVAGT